MIRLIEFNNFRDSMIFMKTVLSCTVLFYFKIFTLFQNIIIIDGYTDEPSGLGVPPYIGVYPRLVAGIIWFIDKSKNIRYYTIDTVRANLNSIIKNINKSDLVVFIAGSEVPGKYIGGKPITIDEIEYLSYLLKDCVKILVGPAARFGLGSGGGFTAVATSDLAKFFDIIVTGDPELFFYDLIKYGFEKADPSVFRENYDLANKAFIYGSKIVKQHPNYGWNLIVEIETYRGCPRWITGGCSFCIEPRYGRPIMRNPEDIVSEVESLYKHGVRHIRLGKQPDILTYMSGEIGLKEFPKPNVNALEKLFHGIRLTAPGLRTIHIDNVNPGTIVHNIKESIEAIKIIIKYHTPGDVAALGIESFDEKVVRLNNLKVYPDEALEAIRLINKYGSVRGWNGLPHLLPGINLLHGLPGESRETYRLNILYLNKIIDEKLLVRRVNIRKISILEKTPLWIKRDIVMKNIRKYSRLFNNYRKYVMEFFDKKMLSRITPSGCVLRYLFVERRIGEYVIARQPASYPIVVKIRDHLNIGECIDARVKKSASKSVLASRVV